MSLITIFNQNKRFLEIGLEILYEGAPLSEEYKNDKDNSRFYVKPIINIMSTCLKNIELPSSEFKNIDHYTYQMLLTKISISCFWIINKYEDDYPLTYEELRKCSHDISKNELEILERWILKKIDYQISKYIEYDSITNRITKNIVTPPYELKLYTKNGKPPLYVKPRSNSFSLTVDTTNNNAYNASIFKSFFSIGHKKNKDVQETLEQQDDVFTPPSKRIRSSTC